MSIGRSAVRRAVRTSMLGLTTVLVLSGCGSIRGERAMVDGSGAVVEVPLVSEPLTPAGTDGASALVAPVVEVPEDVAVPAAFQFTATLVDGGSIAGDELTADAPVLMTFVQPTCPISHEEAPKIAAAARLHPEITYVIVHSGGSVDDYRAMTAEAGLDAPNIVHVDDSDQQLWKRFGVTASPSSILVDAAGLVRSSYGALGESGLERAADSLYAGF